MYLQAWRLKKGQMRLQALLAAALGLIVVWKEGNTMEACLEHGPDGAWERKRASRLKRC